MTGFLLSNKILFCDKTGEQHYDIVSAFIKSIRGSDPNGAVYWTG
jgi:putative ATPase